MPGHRRFFADGISYPENTEATLTGQEFVHARKVMRADVGTEVTLLGGDGREYDAVVTSVGQGSMTLHITGETGGGRDPVADIYLLTGVLKGDRTELVIQKATELGVKRIGVFRSEYSSGFISDGKEERWRRVAREATKQCMRTLPPEIDVFPSFGGAMSSAAAYGNRLFFCEFGERESLGPGLFSEDAGYALAVGSEGGFTEEEYRLARETYGFLGVSLGKRILRAETAAISAVTLVSYFAGELK